ncbi:MAG TPA: hypothetical protein VLU24_04275, partial [Mycobacterium sp.]|nr:hypothetical protein [Mycobacterium sp.]
IYTDSRCIITGNSVNNNGGGSIQNAGIQTINALVVGNMVTENPKSISVFDNPQEVPAPVCLVADNMAIAVGTPLAIALPNPTFDQPYRCVSSNNAAYP